MPAVDVVYVHGLWLTGHESLVLRRRLARDFGFRLHAFHYRTVSSPMAEVTERLEEFVREIGAPRLHFVGHSLGGLVIYRYLERFADPPPGRVVFLGTPSVESKAAVGVASRRWSAPLVGRCLAEEMLTPRERSWTANRDLGIVAGTRPVGLGQLVANFGEDCDGTVAVSETRLAGATDHITLPVSHLGMLLSARVAREVGAFLERGRFSL